MAERKGAAQNGQAHLLFSIHIIDQQIWAIGGIAEPRKHERCIRHETRHAGEVLSHMAAPTRRRDFRRSIIAQTPRRRDFAFAAKTEGAHARSPAKAKAPPSERKVKATLYGTQGRIATPCAIRRREGRGSLRALRHNEIRQHANNRIGCAKRRDIGEIRRLRCPLHALPR